MGHSTYFKNALANHIFKNLAITNIGNAGGLLPSSADGSFYISFHTADPSSGNQSTSEATYAGYARKAVARNTGFSVSGGQITNVGEIVFDICTSGNNTITHIGIGTASSGNGTLLYVHALGTDSFVVRTGIIASFDPSQLVITY